MPADHCLQFESSSLRQTDRLTALLCLAHRLGRRRLHDRQRRRRLNALQHPPPIALKLRYVLLCKPGNIVAIGAARLMIGFLTFADSLVKNKEFLEEQRYRPSIQQQMMIAERELIAPFRKPHERNARQRCLGKIEAASAVALQE